MRIDSFLVASGLLLCSLLTLIFGDSPMLTDVAYIAVLLSMGLLAVDDWLDWLLIKVSSPRALRPATKRLAKKAV